MPRTAFRVVWGMGDTMETFSPLAVFKKVDLPADGRPTMATTAVLGPMGWISSCSGVEIKSLTGCSIAW